jgi:hypothetical protein
MLVLRGHATSPKSRVAALLGDTPFFARLTQPGATAQIASLGRRPHDAASR